jgi:sugar/nucleoside kinase (ribokinase family)
MKYRALFIGLTTIDIQYFVDEFPEPNRKIKTKPPELFVGGPATNAAVAFAKLNKGVFLATPIGKNGFTSVVQDDFKRNQISHFDLAGNQSFNPVIASVISR